MVVLLIISLLDLFDVVALGEGDLAHGAIVGLCLHILAGLAGRYREHVTEERIRELHADFSEFAGSVETISKKGGVVHIALRPQRK
jgi:hypothetical protein